MSYAVIIEYDQTEYPSMPPIEVEWAMADEEEAQLTVQNMRDDNGDDNTTYTVVLVVD